MSLRDDLLEGATVVSEGAFRLDRRRAVEKLAHFQLEDPHRYVLELLAAAVRAGATRVALRNDADDLEIEWDGLHPTREELDALFDHVFAAGTDDRARMLRHLAQGVHGALGLAPASVKLERPGLTVDLADPLDGQVRPTARFDGAKVHRRHGGPCGVVEARRPDGRRVLTRRQRGPRHPATPAGAFRRTPAGESLLC